MAATIGRVLLIPKGNYSGTDVYNALDWVRDNGAAWVCKVDNTVAIAPPTLPTTSNANWQLLAEDGSVSGSIAWTGVTGKPFDDIKVGGGLNIDGSRLLELDTSMLTGSNISYDNTLSGLTATDMQDAIDELADMSVNLSTDLLAGSNITLTPKPNGKVEISSTGGGGGGSSTLAGLTDVDVTTTPPTDDEVLTYDSGTWVNKPAPSGGHTMIANNTAITSLTAKAVDSTDDDVASGYAIANWSNAEIITLIAHMDKDDDTVGTWEESPLDWKTTGVRTGWIWHSCLYNIVADNEVEISIDFDVAGEEVVGLYAYRVDDNVQNGGVNGGAIAIKLTSPIKNASGVDVAVNLKRQRTQKFNATILS